MQSSRWVLSLVFAALLSPLTGLRAAEPLTQYVNPLLGTATLWDSKDIGYTPTRRTWGAEVFPGASLPNALVQLSPVTQFKSGSGYQYEDKVIQAFTHTCKGHWNLCNVPLLPVTGTIAPDDYASPFSHTNESAHPGYYQVYLQRYGVNVELSSTLRCAFHRYTFQPGAGKKLIAALSTSNEDVRDWNNTQDGEYAFQGFQQTRETLYFYAVANHKIKSLDWQRTRQRGEICVLQFVDAPEPLELRIGFSYVSTKNAKENLEKEMLGKSFAQVRQEATETWEALLSKVRVTGGTERQRRLFYSCLHRSFLWPALRSDVNGQFVDRSRQVVSKGFRYYTDPSLWDDYRNKLVLLGLLTPTVSAEVIQSMIDRGEKTGFMPTFFHGDHAAPYIAGTYLRGIRGYDVQSAYRLLLRNAMEEKGPRPFISEYISQGYISDPDLKNPVVETKGKAGVTKTLEYAYDDYAVALLAKELGDTNNYRLLMQRSANYKHMFDPATGLMRGRLANGQWIEPFDPLYPYYEYMYREANAWQSSFFAPHDMKGLIGLYPSPAAFEQKVDDLFRIPWNGVEACNLSVFIGQYCHGNQPDHGFPFLYYFVGKPEKSQALLNHILDHFYDMGKEHLAYAGMDDAGEMSSWYVFNAIGLYPFSPADAEYLVTVPLFDQVQLQLGDGATFTIVRKNSGNQISEIGCDGQKVDGYFISHGELEKGKTLTITTRVARF
jgi:predicted alpha-1,2-mannosidase